MTYLILLAIAVAAVLVFRHCIFFADRWGGDIG